MSNEHPTLGNGKICYLDIPALNIETSAAFYQRVFHWNIRKRGDGSTSFDDAVAEVSGTWTLNRKPAEPGVMIYIMVLDAEQTVKDIVAHGGTITQPIDMDARERTAAFKDPAGNIFGIYQDRG